MKLRILALAVLALALLTSCISLADDITPPPGYKAPTPVPTMTAAYPKAIPNPANGQAIYLENCTPCHGDAGLGDGVLADQLPTEIAVPSLGLPETANAATPADWFTMVTRGNMQSLMPPFTSLSEAERWDVVSYAFSLSLTPGQVENGQALYETSCAGCHGPQGTNIASADLSNQQFMSTISGDTLLSVIANGVEPSMPGFPELSAQEQQEIAAYVRSLTMGQYNATTAAAAPTSAPETATVTETVVATEDPNATPAATTDPNATPDPNSTAAPTAEATVEATPETPQTGYNVGGKVIHSTGGELPEGLTVELQAYTHDVATGSMNVAIQLETSVDENGNYLFENVELTPEMFVITSAIAGERSFSSDFATELPEDKNLTLDITYYDVTTDASTFSMDRLHIFFDLSVSNTMQVLQLYVGSNSGQQVIVPANDGEALVNYTLPAGAANLQFEDGVLGGRYLETADGFGDTASIAPGEGSYQTVFGFNLPYNPESQTFSQPITIDIAEALVMLPDGVTADNPNLVFVSARDVQGLTYNIYTHPGMQAGDTLEFTITGSPNSGTPSTTESDDSTRNILIGAGALGIALILAGVWMYVRDRNAQPGDEDEDDDDVLATEEDVLDAIIAIDDEFRAGNLSEDAYQNRRAELAAKLKELKN